MRRFSLTCLAMSAAVPLLADGPEITGVRCATYDLVSNKTIPADGGQAQFRNMVWGTTRWSGQSIDGLVLDWGDIADGQRVEEFVIVYVTDLMLPESLVAQVTFFAEENGCDTPNPSPLAGFELTGLPGALPDANTWIITVDLESAGLDFPITGSDLDADGLTDFGYQYWFRHVPPTYYAGVLIADADPNDVPFPAPGIEDAWWRDGECVVSPFGGDPFAQTALQLYGNDSNTPVCPHPGASGFWCSADLEGDCVVSLSDLALLLANYGVTGNATHDMGDIEPDPAGDGDVDLADLALLLAQYGDDCN